MKILVLSDIHANKFALDEVISDADKYYKGYEAVWFLGDLIGYGANPVETYDAVKKACNHNGQHHVWLSGNHEESLRIQEDISNIMISERLDRQHMAELLISYDEAEAHFTNSLKSQNKREIFPLCDWTFFLTHASFVEPTDYDNYLYPWFEDEYYVKLFKKECGALPGTDLKGKCVLYGHTHVSTLVKVQQKADGGIDLDAKKIIPFVAYPLERDCTWFINPGSVGIPSDNDPRASYAIIDLDSKGEGTITFSRVEYGINDALMAMKNKGYDYEFIQDYRARLINASAHQNTPKSWLGHYEMAKLVQRKNKEP